jgi:hypothetical protein
MFSIHYCHVISRMNLLVLSKYSTFPPTRPKLKQTLAKITFDTDAPSLSLGNGDPNRLSFRLSELLLTP